MVRSNSLGIFLAVRSDRLIPTERSDSSCKSHNLPLDYY